ncbi:MAG: hypothetical protein IJ097_00135 [Bacilli bacterium]|nr:hypothetical protein [Bacilli bacterium]
MRKTKLISCLTLVVAIIMMSIGMIIQSKDYFNVKTEKVNMKDMTASAININDEKLEEKKETTELKTDISMDTAPAGYIKIEKVFSEISTEEAIAALQEGSLKMEYTAVYSYNGLTKSRGAMYFNGHKETYYSEKVLPGNSLAIPGRHVADDGTIRDADGYICVAADPTYAGKGTILITSLGPAKVYDSGCAYGTIDIYVSW